MTTRGRWSPLHGAFTFTALAAILLIAGSLGYEIRKSGGVPFLRPTGVVVWGQIWWGSAAALVAAVLWAVSLRPSKPAGRETFQRVR